MSDDFKTPDEWCKLLGWQIMDPDGWRGAYKQVGIDGPRDYEDPITQDEFNARVIMSTVRHAPEKVTDIPLNADEKDALKEALMGSLTIASNNTIRTPKPVAAIVKMIFDDGSSVEYVLVADDSDNDMEITVKNTVSRLR